MRRRLGIEGWRKPFALVGKGLRAELMPGARAFDLAIQDAHRVARCQASPDRVWVRHHNGVFRSDDGGQSFFELLEVPPSTFGFAVVAHPRDPDAARLVPAKKDEARYPVNGAVVVTRTRDGGKS